jgi:tetratricopeptide (TPR) repeat protein
LALGGLCCFLLAGVFAVWQMGRKWDVGGVDDFSEVVVSTPLQLMSSPPEPLSDPGTAAPATNAKSSPGEIESLLAEAKEILGRSRRIGSRDLEIAEKLYRQVLVKDTTSREAGDGLERIRELYRAATEEELQASNFSQATNHMRKGMFLAPKDGRFSLLQETFAAQKQKLINQLTEKAEEAMRSNRLITPVDDNAFQYYKEILTIDPQNKTALEGLTKIGDNYADLAEKAFRHLKIPDAKEYVRQGLAVNPQHPHLLQLQKDLTKGKAGLFFKGMEKYLKTAFQ